jgi:hypothetical protein
MAPSETANPRKRSKPPFNPPRPKTNGTGISKSRNSTSTRKANIGSIFNEGTRKSQATAKSTTKARKQRPAVREQEPEDDDDDDDDAADDSLLDDEAEGEEDEVDDEPTEQEADMMLAEITHDLSADEALEPSIPIPLLHRIMHHSFKNPEETKLSTDARACVGRYIETFIREGIARCAFEVGEKATEGRSDSALGHDDGWLEVEDLERVGGQLVLDF